MNFEIRTNIERERPFGDRLCVTFYGKREKEVLVCQPLTFCAIDPAINGLPAVKITPSEAQEIMDELWRNGIRPSEGSGSAGQLAAVQYHLEDMRKLVFR